jgi:hypothetical protein
VARGAVPTREGRAQTPAAELQTAAAAAERAVTDIGKTFSSSLSPTSSAAQITGNIAANYVTCGPLTTAVRSSPLCAIPDRDVEVARPSSIAKFDATRDDRKYPTARASARGCIDS